MTVEKKELSEQRLIELRKLLARTEVQGKLLDDASVFNLTRGWLKEAIEQGDAIAAEKKAARLQQMETWPLWQFAIKRAVRK